MDTNEQNLKSAIEALLFASENGLTIEQLKDALGLNDVSILRQALSLLKSDCEQLSRGIRVAEIAGGFRLITAPDFAPFLKKLFKSRRVERLSRQALETLAIIAYKQPLTRAEIELLRNVNVDAVMKSLLDKNLIRISGRRGVPGRPYVFGTTMQFLEHFGLRSLEDLPKMENLSQQVKELAAKQEASAAV